MIFKDILNFHFVRYPLMQIQDVYKLVYQAALGSEHAAADPDAARHWLEHEIAELEPGPVEALVDPISPEGKFVRVHLRPYVQHGYSPARLGEAFLAAAKEYSGRASLLEEYWLAAIEQNRFPAADMEDFIQEMKARGYAAVHHSTDYRQAYLPAYRVILQKHAKGFLK
jgi:hypothetical protein